MTGGSEDWLFSETGGARIGMFNATWPLAKLLVAQEKLCLSVTGFKSIFPKDGTRLSRHRGLFSTGLRLQRTGNAHEDSAIFWTFNFSDLKADLRGLGYEVFDVEIGWRRLAPTWLLRLIGPAGRLQA